MTMIAAIQSQVMKPKHGAERSVGGIVSGPHVMIVGAEAKSLLEGYPREAGADTEQPYGHVGRDALRRLDASDTVADPRADAVGGPGRRSLRGLHETPRAAAESAPQAAPTARSGKTRGGNKQALPIEMLGRAEGATIDTRSSLRSAGSRTRSAAPSPER